MTVKTPPGSTGLFVALGCALVALQVLGAAPELRYERFAILHGEPWRLLTGHLVHLGWAHLGLNLLGLTLLALLLGGVYRPGAWAAIVALSAAGTGTGLLLLSPPIAWYVGFSGVLHGIAAAGAVGLWREDRGSAAALLVLVAAKLLWEQYAGPLPGSGAMAGGRVITDAHLYGAIAGLIAAGAPGIFRPARTAA